jgi:hypothetical protein
MAEYGIQSDFTGSPTDVDTVVVVAGTSILDVTKMLQMQFSD